MVAAIRQQVTVQADGLIEVRSPELRAGARAEVIVLVEQPAAPVRSPEDPQVAWERLLRHAGAVKGGDPRAGDNDRIDADLAREYGKDDGAGTAP
jgi:hypothetical protein